MNNKIESKEILKTAKDISFVVFGTAILAFGFAVFMIPYDLVAGGVTGIAIILDRFISSDIVTVDLIVTVLTWTIFFLGLIFLGKSFAAKTLVSTIVYPPCISLFMNLTNPDFLGGYFYLQGNETPEIALLIAPFLGGVLVGVGCALTFLGGGSTGGTDILAFIICKIIPRLKSSLAIFLVDVAVIVLGVFVIDNIVISTLGIASAFVSALLVDKVFLGGQKTFIAQIISNRYEEIKDKILCDMERGATIIDVSGAYTGDKYKMIMVSFTMRQYNQMLNVINKTDKSAFLTIHRAHEINGEGFSR